MAESESYLVLAPGDLDAVSLLRRRMEAGGGEVAFVGVGRSMEPAVLSGDRVLIREISGEPRVGWIVVFPWKGRVLTHRVVRTGEGVFFARGDACVEVEGPVDASEVIGRVVSYRRDGRWRSVDGEVGRVAGLVYNVGMNRVRAAAKRWPRLRWAVETGLLGAGIVRDGYSRIGEWVFGRVFVEEETRIERVVGAVVSAALPLTQDLVSKLKRGVRERGLHLLVAHTPRRRWVGKVLLYKAGSKRGVPAGYVSNFLVALGFRGMGVEGKLLSAVEDAARGDGLGRLVALVEPDNILSLTAFSRAGYRRVTAEELAGRSEEERETVPGDRVLLEKVL